MTNTEHEKLKEICDVIGYKINDSFYYWDKKGTLLSNRGENIAINPREIIFTKEFMNALVVHLDKINLLGEVRNYEDIGKGIIFNLKNPVNYLYNKLGLND